MRLSGPRLRSAADERAPETDGTAVPAEDGTAVDLLDRPDAAEWRSTGEVPDSDERSDRTDVVKVGDLPPIERPVTPRRFRNPAPATDALRGW
ncbi:MAG: hypothetical protein M3Y77_10690, partial [Actinomycetota bacterium]|nr:hypothetical protein [Actinomycetota bacterium]